MRCDPLPGTVRSTVRKKVEEGRWRRLVWRGSDGGYDDEVGGTSEHGLAERVGIEPTVPLPGQQFSRLPDSATLAPLRLVELA